MISTLLILVALTPCPSGDRSIDLYNDPWSQTVQVDTRSSENELELADCEAAPLTDGGEYVVEILGRRDGTWVQGTWSGDFDAVIYFGYEFAPDTDPESCFLDCAAVTGEESSFSFWTEYTVDSELARFYLVVDAAEGVAGTGELSLDMEIGVPVLDRSWGSLKRSYRNAE